jgi:hypothetical protein
MPAPSQLAIATSVLNRLIKEEKSYHKELEQQNVKIAKLEAGEFIIRQQVSDVTDRCNLSTHCVGLYRHVLTNMSRSKQLSRPRQSFLA